MKKLKCSSCGAELHIEDNKEYAVCNHCGSRYKLNEDLNVNIKLDDNMKEVLNNGLGTVKNASKVMIIPFILFALIFIAIFVFGFININKSKKSAEENREKIHEQVKEQNEIINKQQEEAKKEMFNFQFANDNGTKSAFFLESTLDEIIESNKTQDRLVTLVFNGKEVTEESEIINIKHSLKGDYEVSFNYDDEGYINKIIVDKIK